jgi:DNA-binding NarL/FixJ family response regulator
MIRILALDDHRAPRAGLTAVLRAEPGFAPFGTAVSDADLWPALHRTKPDVVVLDDHLPGDEGLVLCRRIKRETLAPCVLLCSAQAGASLTIPALLAGVDGLVDKAAPARELYGAIRRIRLGERVLPPVSRDLLDRAVCELERADLAILGMMLERVPAAEVAGTLGIGPGELARRIDRMIRRLTVEVPVPRDTG